jgi:flagellar basal-body rod protein FlgG
MNKGIYIALSGAVLKNNQMDAIAQNLANANTIGYKKDTLSFKDYLLPKDPLSPQPEGRVMSNNSVTKTDFSSGSIIRTGNPLDVAIQGDGFITLEGGRYTRRGDLKRDGQGYLITNNNTKVLGNNGAIRLPDGMVHISESGDISVNGERIDTLQVVDFKDKNSLKKLGDSIFTTVDAPVKSTATLKQEYVETSNVDVVREMVRMISTLRDFESYQKAIQAYEEAAAKMSNEMLRLG